MARHASRDPSIQQRWREVGTYSAPHSWPRNSAYGPGCRGLPGHRIGKRALMPRTAPLTTGLWPRSSSQIWRPAMGRAPNSPVRISDYTRLS